MNCHLRSLALAALSREATVFRAGEYHHHDASARVVLAEDPPLRQVPWQDRARMPVRGDFRGPGGARRRVSRTRPDSELRHALQ